MTSDMFANIITKVIDKITQYTKPGVKYCQASKKDHHNAFSLDGCITRKGSNGILLNKVKCTDQP